MLETTNYLFQNTSGRSNPYGAEYRVSPAARQLYQRARRQGYLGQMVARLTGNRTARQLMPLEMATRGRTSRARHYVGIRTVRLSEIRGSVGRRDDFDATFHPLQANTEQRWLRVATARQEGLGLAPIKLFQVGQVYFVQDGHHRVSVARARGENEIEAEVTAWGLA